MKLLKRVCVLKEIENGYSYSGKQAKAMAKCQKTGAENSISLSFMDLAPLKHGSYIIVVGNSEKCVYFSSDETGIQKDFHDSLIDFALPFSVSVIYDDGEKTGAVLFGQTSDCNETPLSMKNAYVTKKREKEKEFEKTEKIIDDIYNDNETSAEIYSDDVVATENYFENSDVDAENFTLIEDEKESVDCAFLQEDLDEIMKSYPPFEELEKSVYGSKWVKIELEKGEYYFGKAKIHDEKYLCYAVRGKKDCCPEELKSLACFIPSPSKTETEDGFFVMFQCEENGKIKK